MTDERVPKARPRSSQMFWDDVRENPNRTAQQFWDDFYVDNTWNERGPVGRHLVAEVELLTPGMALDLGCGEGSDAIWLAQRGWQVTAADVSATALDRARAHAERLGLSNSIRFEQHDLAVSLPAGTFDLVSAQFLHSPVAIPSEREDILRRATQAVAPGGSLIVVSHNRLPSWAADHPVELAPPTPGQTVAALELVDGEWETVHAETVLTEVTSPEGERGTREDHVLHYRRLVATA